MTLNLVRYSTTELFRGSTLGVLYIDGKFECYTLEDEERIDLGKPKVMAETAIPRGKYTIGLATWGSLHEAYAKRYGDLHKGMLLLNNVPQFEGILIHCGVNESHTEGCIILGDQVNNNRYAYGDIQQCHYVAYPRVYAKVLQAITAGETPTIEVSAMY